MLGWRWQTGGSVWHVNRAEPVGAAVGAAKPSRKLRYLTPWLGCSRYRAEPRPRHSRTPPSAPWPPSQGPRPGRHTPTGRTRQSAPWSRQTAHRWRSVAHPPPGSWSPWRRPAAAPAQIDRLVLDLLVEGEERLEEPAFLRAARRRRLGRVGGQDQGVLHGGLLASEARPSRLTLRDEHRSPTATADGYWRNSRTRHQSEADQAVQPGSPWTPGLRAAQVCALGPLDMHEDPQHLRAGYEASRLLNKTVRTDLQSLVQIANAPPK
jgi:hypothetical protein